jgi:hypothetical protein
LLTSPTSIARAVAGLVLGEQDAREQAARIVRIGVLRSELREERSAADRPEAWLALDLGRLVGTGCSCSARSAAAMAGAAPTDPAFDGQRRLRDRHVGLERVVGRRDLAHDLEYFTPVFWLPSTRFRFLKTSAGSAVSAIHFDRNCFDSEAAPG